MIVTTSTRHGSISEQTRAKFEAKVEKLGRNFEQVNTVDIRVDLDNKVKPNLEVIVKQTNAPDAIVSIENEELMTALDLAIHKLEQQLRKAKTKKIDSFHAPVEVPAPKDV